MIPTEDIMDFMAEGFWLFAVVGGPLLLAVAFVYALARRRKLTRAEREQSDRATRELYGKPKR